MGYILSSIIVSIICVLTHFLFFTFQKNRCFSSDLVKLLYHAKVIFFIWLFYLPLWVWIYNIFYFSLNIFISKTVTEIILILVWHIVFLFIYLTIYYIIDRSVSSRIMMELDKYQRLSLEELIEIYNIDEKFNNVIQGMLEGKFVYEKDERLYCTFKGKILGFCAYYIKKILKLGRGG